MSNLGVISLGTSHCPMKLRVFQAYMDSLGFTCDSCISIILESIVILSTFVRCKKVIMSIDVSRVLVLF